MQNVHILFMSRVQFLIKKNSSFLFIMHKKYNNSNNKIQHKQIKNNKNVSFSLIFYV